ncbi:MAG: dual specificity protein phosphatase family protein [Actinomycetes bacterium]
MSPAAGLPAPDDYGAWHRLPCAVLDTDGAHSGVVVTGDLHADPDAALEQLAGWVADGAGGIVDCRVEWTDANLVAAHYPELDYLHVGVDDHGGRQPDSWFDQGVDGALEVLGRGDQVVVHCHMGINRGPSMAFAVLLCLGWQVGDALVALQQARPVVGLLYAGDAIGWFGRRSGWTEEQEADAQAVLTAWREGAVDVDHVIRKVRDADDA